MKGIVSDLNTQSTELQEAGKILRESEAKFGNIFEHSPLGISLTQLDGRLNADQAYCDILGYSEDELQAKNWKEITHPEDILKSDQVIQALLDGKILGAHLQKRYIHKNGNTIWADVTTVLQRDESGKLLYFLTTIGDITKRKQADEVLCRRSSGSACQMAKIFTLINNGWITPA
jgi:PAS domain S-box-containing protein